MSWPEHLFDPLQQTPIMIGLDLIDFSSGNNLFKSTFLPQSPLGFLMMMEFIKLKFPNISEYSLLIRVIEIQ